MLIDSKNAIKEAYSLGIVKKIYIKEGIKEQAKSLLFNKEKIVYLSDFNFRKKFSYFNSNMVAEVDFNYVDLKSLLAKEERFIILDHIQDPQNFGTIIRAAHLFNFKNIIIAKNNQVQVTNAVVRASAGSIFYVNICRVVNIARAVETLKDYNFFVYAIDIRSKKTIENISLGNKFALIFGSEGKGIRKNLFSKSDDAFKIDIFGKIDSLNVSQSAAILLYEINKRKI
ncbi:MAG: RNA methyltransferase [Deferribacterota bacterium]|nr:RNA methyltransferase [Deferribacterota bacterium]